VSGRACNRQQGQILVLAAILMTFFFIPLAVLVVDTGLVESSYAQLNETVQAAAEDGASMLNEGLYRSSNGRIVQLDPVLAAARCAHRKGRSAVSFGHRHVLVGAVEGHHVPAQEHVAVEVLLERSHHLVPRARQLGGDLVG